MFESDLLKHEIAKLKLFIFLWYYTDYILIDDWMNGQIISTVCRDKLECTIVVKLVSRKSYFCGGTHLHLLSVPSKQF